MQRLEGLGTDAMKFSSRCRMSLRCCRMGAGRKLEDRRQSVKSGSRKKVRVMMQWCRYFLRAVAAAASIAVLGVWKLVARSSGLNQATETWTCNPGQ